MVAGRTWDVFDVPDRDGARCPGTRLDTSSTRASECGRLQRTRTITSRFRFSVDEKTLAAVELKVKRTFFALPAAGFSGAEPAPAGAQTPALFVFHWAANGDLLMDNDHSLERLSGWEQEHDVD